jgi:DNA helicase-2/ATP-dependent DNA helicase PcrA
LAVVKQLPQYELDSSTLQTLNLAAGADCHYDRPSIGLSYAVWYLPRRIHDALMALLPLCCSDEDLSILDLGSGNGATWMAALLIERARASLGRPPRSVRITAVDSSAPMTDCGRRMWATFADASALGVTVDSAVRTWTDAPPDGSPSVILASYLLDHSDGTRAAELSRSLLKIAEQVRARDLVLVSASNKRGTTETVLREVTRLSQGWSVVPGPTQAIWSGEAIGVHQVRQTFARLLSADVQSRLGRRPPSWADDSSVIHRLSRTAYQSLDLGPEPQSWSLDESQELAATPSERLTVIVGAAGSGKSRVLVERLVRQLDLRRQQRSATTVLVTAFNKEVVEQLRSWTSDALAARPAFHGRFRSTGSDGAGITDIHPFGPHGPVMSVEFMNWDKAPLRLFGVPYKKVSSQSEEVLQKIIDRWCADDTSGARRRWVESRSWMTPQFLQEELTRVVYGLGAIDEHSYFNAVRKGRPQNLARAGNDRQMLWSLMRGAPRTRLYVDNRIAALQRVFDGHRPAGFDYLFFDECQDLLPAEFSELLPSLVPDPVRICVVGDAAQALHTGSSYARPRSVARERALPRRRWEEHNLSGSYRLPIRICEALAPLAEELLRQQRTSRASGESDARADSEVVPEDLISPVSMKSAVIGVRPVMVVAQDMSDLARQTGHILTVHRELVLQQGNRPRLTYAESSERAVELERALRLHEEFADVEVLGESMLKIKGLERPVVVWDTKNLHTTSPGASALEWAYTVLTRTTGLLIIHMSALTAPELMAFLSHMRKDRLLFWTKEAEERFDSWARAR